MKIEVRRYPGESSADCTSRILDTFYMQNGPCCAGCDWWESHNTVAGDCTRTAPVPGGQRFAMLGITGSSLPIASGHVMTLREHKCGEFKDSFDWSTLPFLYLKRIGTQGVRGQV